MASRTYRAHVGDTAYDLTFDGDRLLLGGEPIDATFEALGGGRYVLIVEGRSAPVVVEAGARAGTLRVTLGGQARTVRVQDEQDLLLERFGLEEDVAAGEREVRAPMPGLVLKVLVEEGEAVAADQGLVVLEAMKMENELRASAAGTVATIHATPGEPVDKDALLIELDVEEGA
jgi:pyruvate carboxylase subunit B